MYSVRNMNGSTRWSEGIYSEQLGYYIKYYSEYERCEFYKTLVLQTTLGVYKTTFVGMGITIDNFYSSLYEV